MKPFDQLTKEELVALTNEQVEYYCDLACAENGVPLMMPEPVAPTKPEAEQTVQLVKFNHGYRDFYMTPEHGAAIFELLSSQKLYETKGKSPYEHAEVIAPDDYNYPKMEAAKFLSPGDAANFKTEIEDYGRLKAEYDNLLSEYKRVSEKRENVTSYIYDAISEARELLSRISTARKNFNRYLVLAEDNKTVAMNFLVRANPTLREDDFGPVVEELCPGYVLEPVKEPEQETDEDDD